MRITLLTCQLNPKKFLLIAKAQCLSRHSLPQATNVNPNLSAIRAKKLLHRQNPRIHFTQNPVAPAVHQSEEKSLNTWQNNPKTSSLQNQGSALNTYSATGTQIQTATGQAVSAEATNIVAATATSAGIAVQATEKVVTKIKETIEDIAANDSKNTSSWGSLAALFLLPLLIVAVVSGAFRGGSTAKNVILSDDVVALMPQISTACQTHGIPEYAPLAAAVIMQELRGHAEAVGGGVMQCAEGMGLPVGTSVSVEESINFGTRIIAANLRLAGVAGPTDISGISLALQGYNFGNE